ncbi:uncharacterized protein LOC143836659 [Paroedura picta]|uniref:uncharacterized protein LOC143836659 n=1 Tax=Paroedura picta TaxID=143630 RepID=UPI00405725F3
MISATLRWPGCLVPEASGPDLLLGELSSVLPPGGLGNSSGMQMAIQALVVCNIPRSSVQWKPSANEEGQPEQLVHLWSTPPPLLECVLKTVKSEEKARIRTEIMNYIRKTFTEHEHEHKFYCKNSVKMEFFIDFPKSCLIV